MIRLLWLLFAAAGVGCHLQVYTSESGSETSTSVFATSSSSTSTSTAGSTTSTSGAAASTSGTSTSTSTSPTDPLPDFPMDRQECDVYAPHSCPLGQKCIWTFESYMVLDMVCVPLVPDPKQPGEPCQPHEEWGGPDECDLGTMCLPIGTHDHVSWTCTPLCKGDLDHLYCDPGWSCFSGGRSLYICRRPCDPLVQDCPLDQVCSTAWPNTTDCMWADPGYYDTKPGQPCEWSEDCAPGSHCVEAVHVPDCAGETCCTDLCRVDDNNTCTLPGQSCTLLVVDGEPPAIPDLGFCTLP